MNLISGVNILDILIMLKGRKMEAGDLDIAVFCGYGKDKEYKLIEDSMLGIVQLSLTGKIR